jgi:riboflavin biosynthesis pyrimidine reductase
MTTLVAPASGTRALEVLFDGSAAEGTSTRGGEMPVELARRYGGPLVVPLRPDRPTFVANFVATVDGVVALGSGDLSGGGLISGFHEPDRFVMALLRAVADVVVIGAGTLRGSTSHRWTPAHVQPALAGELAEWRRAMGLSAQPTTIVVSGSGQLPVDHPGLNDPAVPVVIATTPSGAAHLRGSGLPGHVAVEAIGDGESLSGLDILGLVACQGARVALSEGGPHLLGELVAADLLDELYLTVAPQIVGRDADRIGLVEGISLAPDAARWQELVSVRRSGHHLFLRYRRSGTDAVTGES